MDSIVRNVLDEKIEKYATPETYGDLNASAEPTLEEKVDELLTILRPLAPTIAALPDLMQQVGPFIEGAKKSPVLRMMGITIP